MDGSDLLGGKDLLLFLSRWEEEILGARQGQLYVSSVLPPASLYRGTGGQLCFC